jgi:hypothetical protein
MQKLLIFLGMAAVTYFTRYTMIALLGRELPILLRRWLRYVPVAVLAALIVPAALAPQGRLEFGANVWAGWPPTGSCAPWGCEGTARPRPLALPSLEPIHPLR